MDPTQPALCELKLKQRELTERFSQLRGRRLEIPRDEVRAAEQAVAAQCHVAAGHTEAQLKSEIHNLLTRCERAERLLKHADQVEEDSIGIEKRFRTLQVEHLSLQDSHQQTTAALHDVEARFAATQKLATESTAGQHRLRSRCTVLETSLNRLEGERNGLNTDVQRMQGLVHEADTTAVQLRGSLAASEEKKNQVESAVKVLEAQLSSGTAEVEGLKEIINRLEAEMHSMADEAQRREIQKDARILQIQRELDTTRDTIIASKNTEEVLRSRIETERQSRETSEAETSTLLMNVHHSKDEANQALQRVTSDLRIAKEDNAALQASEEELRTRLAAVSEELLMEREGGREAEERYVRDTAGLREAKMAERSAANTAEIAESLRQEMELAVGSLKADNADLRAELASSTHEMQAVMTELSRERKIAEGLRAASHSAAEVRAEKEAIETELALLLRTHQHTDEARTLEMRRLSSESAHLNEALAVRSAEMSEMTVKLSLAERQMREETEVVEKLSHRLEEAQDYRRQQALIQQKYDSLSVSYDDLVDRMGRGVNIEAAVSELKLNREVTTESLNDIVKRLHSHMKGIERSVEAFQEGIMRQQQLVGVLGVASQEMDSVVAVHAGAVPSAASEQMAKTLQRVQTQLRSAVLSNVSHSERLYRGIRDAHKEGEVEAANSHLTSACLLALKNKIQTLAKTADSLESVVNDIKGAKGLPTAKTLAGGGQKKQPAKAATKGTPIKTRPRQSSVVKPTTPRAAFGRRM